MCEFRIQSCKMNRNRGNKTKEIYGTAIRRSEYDDSIIRNNQRTRNRFNTEMQYHDRAQKVIMKDLGKESHILQNKLENDRKPLSFGLFGSKFGTTYSSKTPRKYTPTSPFGQVTSSNALRPGFRSSNTTETKFPWDTDVSDGHSAGGRESFVSNHTTPRSSFKLRSTSSLTYSASRAQNDDFLAQLLDEAMNDEVLYTQSPEARSPSKVETTSLPKTPRTSRRRYQTPVSSMNGH